MMEQGAPDPSEEPFVKVNVRGTYRMPQHILFTQHQIFQRDLLQGEDQGTAKVIFSRPIQPFCILSTTISHNLIREYH